MGLRWMVVALLLVLAGSCAPIPDYYPDPPARSAAPRSAGGPVQVRGYYRRDGTYVHPHTRRRPR